MNFRRLYALSYRETIRFLKVWTQTLLSSVMISVLYFAVFGGALSSQITEIANISYLAFIVPGLMIMQATLGAFQNPSSSLIISKYHGTIKDLLTSPFSAIEKTLGFMIGGIIRGMMVSITIVFVAMAFIPSLTIEHPIMMIVILFLSSAVFSALGTLAGIWSKTFDHAAGISTFIVTPMGFLGGVFYSLEMLPPLAQQISHFNPIVYMVDSLRYAFFGTSFISITFSFTIITTFFILSTFVLWIAFRNNWRMK